MIIVTLIMEAIRSSEMSVLTRACVLRLLVTAVSRSLILSTLMMEPIRYSETWVLRRATRRNIPEDDILHSHCRENLTSYIALTGGLFSGVVMCFL
jgi:hypothetical protein